MSNKSQRHCMFGLVALAWAAISCTTIAEPNETTTVLTYPPPLITSIRILEDYRVEATIRSYVQSGTDFTNYNLFMSRPPSSIEATSYDDLNQMEEVDEMANYFTTTEPPVSSSSGFQQVVYSNAIDFLAHEAYTIAATCFGISEFYAKVQQHNGWVQSELSEPKSFYVPEHYILTLNNHFAQSAGSSLIVNSGGVEVAGPSTAVDLATLNAALTFYLDDHNGTNRLFLVSSLDEGFGVQNIGYLEDYWEALLPPDSGYLRRTAFLVESTHVYVLRTPVGYVKLQVTSDVPASFESTGEEVVVGLRASLMLGLQPFAF